MEKCPRTFAKILCVVYYSIVRKYNKKSYNVQGAILKTKIRYFIIFIIQLYLWFCLTYRVFELKTEIIQYCIIVIKRPDL